MSLRQNTNNITHLMAFLEETWLAGGRNVNYTGLQWSKRWQDGSGISWTICKSICTYLLTDHHASASPLFSSWMLFLTPNQQCQSTEGTVRVLHNML